MEEAEVTVAKVREMTVNLIRTMTEEATGVAAWLEGAILPPATITASWRLYAG